MDKGYIYLDRCIRKHWIYSNNAYFSAFVKMLFEVNFEDAKPILIKGRFVDCKRGQSLNCLDTWVSVFGKGWSKQKVRTFFELLKRDEIINTENLVVTTRLTICNYESYQNKQHANNTHITSKQHASNTQATQKEVKKEKRSKESKFIKPSIEDVVGYITERGVLESSEAEKFHDFYESKGWMVGKNKMKNWKAAVRNWEKGNNNSKKDDDWMFR